MLYLAEPREDDLLYDLGCGDGRVVLEAARFGLRAVGFDHDAERIEACRTAAAAARLTDRAVFIEADLFAVDLGEATIVTLFLTRDHNLRLQPRLFEQLRWGTRVVSHYHDMGRWEPDRIDFVRGRAIYRWDIGPRYLLNPTPESGMFEW
jgi:precorrin-6B methylase 2